MKSINIIINILKFILPICVLLFMFNAGEMYGELNEHKSYFNFFTDSLNLNADDPYDAYLIERYVYFSDRIRTIGLILLISLIMRIGFEYHRDKPNHWLHDVFTKSDFAKGKI